MAVMEGIVLPTELTEKKKGKKSNVVKTYIMWSDDDAFYPVIQEIRKTLEKGQLKTFVELAIKSYLTLLKQHSK